VPQADRQRYGKRGQQARAAGAVLSPVDEDLAQAPVVTLVGGEVEPFRADGHGRGVPAATSRHLPLSTRHHRLSPLPGPDRCHLGPVLPNSDMFSTSYLIMPWAVRSRLHSPGQESWAYPSASATSRLRNPYAAWIVQLRAVESNCRELSNIPVCPHGLPCVLGTDPEVTRRLELVFSVPPGAAAPWLAVSYESACRFVRIQGHPHHGDRAAEPSPQPRGCLTRARGQLNRPGKRPSGTSTAPRRSSRHANPSRALRRSGGTRSY
jgi:hypothetical protein